MRSKPFFTLVVLAAGGCATEPPPPPAVPAFGPTLAPTASAPLGSNSGETVPVYRPPKIARIYLRAHVDTNGRLVGPQVIYQIVEPGGWNLEAVDHSAAKPEPVIDPGASAFLAQ